MHLIRKIMRILGESTDTEIYLSQMAMNTLFCESEFLGVTQKYLIVKALGIEFLIEPGVEKEFEEVKEVSYFRIQTVQDMYQRTGVEANKILL